MECCHVFRCHAHRRPRLDSEIGLGYHCLLLQGFPRACGVCGSRSFPLILKIRSRVALNWNSLCSSNMFRNICILPPEDVVSLRRTSCASRIQKVTSQSLSWRCSDSVFSIVSSWGRTKIFPSPLCPQLKSFVAALFGTATTHSPGSSD